MKTDDLTEVALESIATLSGRVEEMSAQMDVLSNQLRVLSKRFNICVAALQDHEALVNRLAGIEEVLAEADTVTIATKSSPSS